MTACKFWRQKLEISFVTKLILASRRSQLILWPLALQIDFMTEPDDSLNSLPADTPHLDERQEETPFMPTLSRTSISSTVTTVPEVGKIDMSLDELRVYIGAHSSLRSANIIATECYAEDPGPTTHRFLILELRRPNRKDVSLRLDRFRGENTTIFQVSTGSMKTTANDRVSGNR